MNITDFLGINIVGAALSAALEWVPASFDHRKKAAVSVIASLAVGAVYTVVRDTAWFPTFLATLGSASTVYALVFNKPKGDA